MLEEDNEGSSWDDVGLCAGESYCAFWTQSKGGTNGSEMVGVASVSRRPRSGMEDKRDHSVELFEFADCAQLTNLESLLVRLQPKTCYHEDIESKGAIASGLKRKVTNLLQVVGVEGCGVSRKVFNGDSTTLFQHIEFLTGESDDALASHREACAAQPLAMAALSALCDRENLTTDGGLRGRFTLSIGQLNRYMRLDAAAIEALNLFPAGRGSGPSRGPEGPESSLLGILDQCKTKNLGTRLLSRWIRQPLLDINEITARQDVVGSLKDDLARREGVRESLGGVPDIDRLVLRLENGRGGLRELYHLYQFVQHLPRLGEALGSDVGGEQPASAKLTEFSNRVNELCGVNQFQKFSSLVESVLDLDMAPREFRVKVAHDESGKLAEISDALQDIEERKEREREQLEEGALSGFGARFENDPGMLKTYGYHFRVNKKHDSDLKRRKEGSYLAVVAACIRWGTSELKELHDEYCAAYSSYQVKQRSIVAEAVGVAASFVPLFEAASTLVAEIDVLASLATAAAYSGDAGYVRPNLAGLSSGDNAAEQESENRAVRVVAARHPCLEVSLTDFIPNNYELVPGKSKFQIVTGPNMGGKSVWLRTLGCLLVMAQMGSFIPASEAELPVVDAVLARVGASDVQLRGVSTFMAEMVEASAIIKTATRNSLVILDELGRGTSTYDGFGLAWAISEHLSTKVKPFALFATHYHELTALESVQGAAVKNKHVTALATPETVTMLYTVNDGPCMESFGINIAKMAGFPDDVVQSAKRKAEQLETFVAVGSDSVQTKRKRVRLGHVHDIVKKFASMDKAYATNVDFLAQQTEIGPAEGLVHN